MHRLTLTATALLALATPASAQSRAPLVTKEQVIACLSIEDATRFAEMTLENDREANEAFMFPRMKDGRCLIIPAGTVVFQGGSDRSPPRGFTRACIRPKGNPECYWATYRGNVLSENFTPAQ